MADHTSEYARLLHLVTSDLADYAVYAYRNHGYLLELLVGVLLMCFAYWLGRFLNRSSTARKIEVLNSFESSKERLSGGQLRTINWLRKLKIFLKVLSALVGLVNLYVHLQS